MRMMIAADIDVNNSTYLHILFVQLQVHLCSGSVISITKKLVFLFPDICVWNANTLFTWFLIIIIMDQKQQKRGSDHFKQETKTGAIYNTFLISDNEKNEYKKINMSAEDNPGSAIREGKSMNKCKKCVMQEIFLYVKMTWLWEFNNIKKAGWNGVTKYKE